MKTTGIILGAVLMLTSCTVQQVTLYKPATYVVKERGLLNVVAVGEEGSCVVRHCGELAVGDTLVKLVGYSGVEVKKLKLKK